VAFSLVRLARSWAPVASVRSWGGGGGRRRRRRRRGRRRERRRRRALRREEVEYRYYDT
jgi:hypothetical protein